MAITQAMTTSFKAELMLAVHDFRATGGDTFKLSLYTSSASLDANTTAYTSSQEVSSSGTNYTAGGGSLTNLGVVTFPRESENWYWFSARNLVQVSYWSVTSLIRTGV